jgi:hypothetical protein
MSEGRLKLNQADPDVASRLSGALTGMASRSKEVAWKTLAGTLVTSLVSAGIAGFITVEKPDSWLGPLIGVLLWLVGFTITMMVVGGGVRRSTETLSGADLRQAAELPTFSRTEAAYVRSLAALADAASLLGESLTQDLLGQLNALAANARSLETQRGQLRTALGATPLSELEQELRELQSRLEHAPDEASRRAIEQSIALCDGRRARAAALAPGVARIEAQQEVIYQTLASVEASLRQMGAAPATDGTAVPAFQVDEIRRSTTEAVTQTKAVEEAVQEVVALGGR